MMGVCWMLGLWWVGVVWPRPSPRPHPRPLSRPAGEGGLFVADGFGWCLGGVGGLVVFEGESVFLRRCASLPSRLHGPFTNGPYGVAAFLLSEGVGFRVGLMVGDGFRLGGHPPLASLRLLAPPLSFGHFPRSRGKPGHPAHPWIPAFAGMTWKCRNDVVLQWSRRA